MNGKVNKNICKKRKEKKTNRDRTKVGVWRKMVEIELHQTL